MTRAPEWQTAVFGVCAMVAALLQLSLQPGIATQLLLLAPLIAIFGLPHGALDLPMAETLWPLDGCRGKLRFMAIYLGLVACVIGLWIVLPGAALVAFLAYSALHFSDDWSHAASPLRWTGGLATIGAPALLHHAEVTTLFAYLVPAGAASWAAAAAAIAGGVAGVGFVVTVLFRPQTRERAALEQAILWGLAALLPPLVYFTVYFCGLHSIRHFDATIRSVPRARRALVTAAGLSAAVTLTGALLLYARSGSDSLTAEGGGMQVIFIGLAALTVPHMLLVDRFKRRG
ncbi:Brp/Blh family beta-carotene 15,15'-dioxygenase [Roseovarius sp. D22-M7]|uniref:Brp/Blh family beta-carotene 15,15'-dioxygenase n=1 Tax=Roseovarius sp. D22-M7 TaxID=3127116 RepID=UPI00300FCD2E